MNKKRLMTGLVLWLTWTLLHQNLLSAQEAGLPMEPAYLAYKEVLQTIHGNETLNGDQRQKLLVAVKKLRKSVHSLDDYPNKKNLPAFNDHLQLLFKELYKVEDALVNDSDDGSWEILRLKGIATNCQTCHSSFHINLRFSDQDVPANFTTFEKAEFFLTSRQYEAAEREYWNYIEAGNYREYGFSYSFYRWIDLVVRMLNDPDLGIRKLKTFITKHPELSNYELHDVSEWLKSFEAWKASGSKTCSDFAACEKYVQNFYTSKHPTDENIDQLNLLLAANGIHKLYESGALQGEEKSRALFYLGLIYFKLPIFFVYELPEIYLKSCIKNYPKTKEATLAFKALKEVLAKNNNDTDNFDENTKLELEKYYKLAYE